MASETPPYELPIEDEKTSWAARENLHDVLTRELLGPADGDDETLQMTPDSRYLIGRIAPAKVSSDTDSPSAEGADDAESTLDIGDDIDAKLSTGVPLPSVDETSGDADEDAAEDAPVKRGLMIPASMGLRFQLPLDVEHVAVRATWGTYEPETTDKLIPGTDRHERVFHRKHHDYVRTLNVDDLVDGATREIQLENDVVLRVDAQTDHCADASRSRRIIEIALCNDTETPTHIPVNAWLFQTQLYVEADGRAVFLPVYDPLLDPERSTEDDELKRLDLQYRDLLEFAIGRTCSADWTVAAGERQATQVRTTWLPTVETPQTRAGETPGAVTDMRALAEAAQDSYALDAALRPIVDGYSGWLDAKRTEAESLPAHLRDTALETIEDAEYVRAQLVDGLGFLHSSEQARECFAFMNTVMAEQRVRSQIAALRITDADLDLDDAAEQVAKRGPGAHSWRTFQLAFILMQVHGLCEPTYARRSVDNLARVELLFFPTGGGKTEAYLGLAAFTFAIRRRQGVIATPDGPLDGGAGVNVLMRYTLRLLTSQQFQRAAALVCAAELERRNDVERWGDEPFRIGLWVGTNVSPKYIREAAAELKRVNEGHGHRLTVLQVKRCPWCGTAITAGDITVDDKAGRVHVYCGEEFGDCPFSRHGEVDGGLPILTVDEEIYRLAPAFLIATVDKFARLAREGQAAHLFGYVRTRCARHGYVHPDDGGCNGTKRHQSTGDLPAAESRLVARLRPIDLIIQDELHLITGALGTTVGLFELAIDALTSWRWSDGQPVKPLIVASTATVRNAGEQTKSLYGRLPLLFPPRVLDAADTYFSTEVPVSKDNPGRRYVGVSTTGVRITTAEIRVAEVLMAGGQLLLDRLGEAADPYMTLVGYFNATRELAGMSRYVQDDVQTALAKGRRGIGLPRRVGTAYGELNLSELTSRVSGTAITDTLDQMALTFDPALDTTAAREAIRARLAANEPVQKRTSRPFDVVLATSMLQVGVDVTRLGLMLMVGQPKNTAEYIQASSRVGRDAGRPGLVVTLGNWARPRDLAHYEAFRHYHETFYAQVEPLSVTPFSVTSLERGLAGVLVSAIRVLEASQLDGLSPERDAWRVNDATASARVKALIDKLVARAVAASPDPLTEGAVRQRLDAALGLWKKRQQSVSSVENKTLVYEKIHRTNASDFAPLVRSAENVPSAPDALSGPPFVVANSMREVQPEINILVSPRPENLMWRPSDDTPQWAPQPSGDQA